MSEPDFLEKVQTFDIILLSETWLSKNHQNAEINNFHRFHLPGNKKTNTKTGRYSGDLTVYYKHCLKGQVNIIETHSRGLSWLKINATLFDFNKDVFICLCYIPPSNSILIPSDDFDFYDEIEKGIEKYSNKGKTFVTGDLNARTSNLTDIGDEDFVLNQDLSCNDSYTNIQSRANSDNTVDSNGRRLLALRKSTNHIIANGRLYDDTK